VFVAFQLSDVSPPVKKVKLKEVWLLEIPGYVLRSIVDFDENPRRLENTKECSDGVKSKRRHDQQGKDRVASCFNSWW